MILSERLCNLLFELSNEDRLRILLKLSEKDSKLTHISRTLNLGLQETSRHLSRLSEEKLISKNANGGYCLTPYGKGAIRMLPSLNFLSKHRDYFQRHTIRYLPDQFAQRIGDLERCSFTDDIMITFHFVESMINEAEEYVWILSDQILMSTQPLLEKAVNRGVEFRLILPESMVPPADFRPLPAIDKVIKRRILDQVSLIVAVTEKKARLSFSTVDEKLDHIGFQTSDDKARKWCKDIFEYYWAIAKSGVPRSYLQGVE